VLIAILGLIQCASVFFFLWNQFHLTMSMLLLRIDRSGKNDGDET
jgi:hypothetical protein